MELRIPDKKKVKAIFQRILNMDMITFAYIVNPFYVQMSNPRS